MVDNDTLLLEGGEQSCVVEHDTRHITKSVAGSGRLKAASVPTGLIAGGAWDLDFNRILSST